MSEAEDGNIFNMEVIINPLAATKAATVPPEAWGIKNQEGGASIFDAVAIIQSCRVMLTPDDFVDLWAYDLEIDNDKEPVTDNAEPPDELEDVGKWIEP